MHTPGGVAPEGRAAVLPEEVEIVAGWVGAGGDVFTVRRNGDRVHPTPGGVVPERCAAVLVEEVDLVVIAPGGDVLAISRDGHRAYITPDGEVPLRLLRFRFSRRQHH